MNQEAETNFYVRLGEAAGVRALVDRFYDIMDAEPAAADIRALHPPDLTGSREKLYLFLCGWLGGPPLFVERYGHPRLRARHLPFAIGVKERDQWLDCMLLALDDSPLGPEEIRALMHAFIRLADHMRNQPE